MAGRRILSDAAASPLSARLPYVVFRKFFLQEGKKSCTHQADFANACSQLRR
jgi:hypothetical protein